MDRRQFLMTGMKNVIKLPKYLTVEQLESHDCMGSDSVKILFMYYLNVQASYIPIRNTSSFASSHNWNFFRKILICCSVFLQRS